MFKYFKLRRENQQLREQLINKDKVIETLFAEISNRDDKIAALIREKEVKNPDPLNFEFPGTEKYFSDFWNNLQKL